ncbi:Cupin domain protein [Campylobacter avium LMG 24591]|uniref:Cupin domain protein n=2 Tax=Campylobacter avium TaxID=522485 RepID=A0A222MUH6_9BACT|nr:Cupin domain protein [Campylobacter avium LMG 24591]OYD79851.1 Cupin domain protein [Campylobacter avium]
MKKTLFILTLLGGVAMADTQTITKSGELASLKGDSKIFSGDVKVSMMFKSDSWRDFGGALVEFSKNARSAWHTHTAGQTLIVTEGEILTKVPGQKASIAKKGDVISCPPNVRHFHGATDTSKGSHIALNQEKDGKNVAWENLVSDSEYKEALKEARGK